MKTGNLHRWAYLLTHFRNGLGLVQNYRAGGQLASGPVMKDAILRSGERITHPSHQAGLVGTILEIWCDNAYRIGEFYTPRPDDVILDVGAHIGLFSIHVKLHESRCRVIALEPSESFAHAEGNLRAFGLERVELHRLAIGGGCGSVKMVSQTQRSIDNRSVAAHATEPGSVRVVSIDDLFGLANVERIAFLKMDVEGAEHDAFLRASCSALARIEKIALEYHDNYRPGTLALLERRLGATHDLEVIPDGDTGHGRLFAALRT